MWKAQQKNLNDGICREANISYCIQWHPDRVLDQAIHGTMEVPLYTCIKKIYGECKNNILRTKSRGKQET